MEACANQLRACWRDSDAALEHGDAEGANTAFSRAFEVIDTFPALRDDDVRALQFLCVLTWVKVAAALEITGQTEEAVEARQQVFTLLDELLDHRGGDIAMPWTSIDFLRGLETAESVDLVGRLYLLCSKAGRKDAVLWGRCFMDFDLKVHGDSPRVVQ
jgi:hypothetical protein